MVVVVVGRRFIAPDAHTPTSTNYHCVIENKEEVKTGAPRTQMSQFVRFPPQRQKKKGPMKKNNSEPTHRETWQSQPGFCRHHRQQIRKQHCGLE